MNQPFCGSIQTKVLRLRVKVRKSILGDTLASSRNCARPGA